jgi:hypothetical protein
VTEQFDLKRGLRSIPPIIVKQLQLCLHKHSKEAPSYIVPLSRQAMVIVR